MKIENQSEQPFLKELLENLIENWENETVEFKRECNSNSEIGKYFSALSNEANLRNKEKAWLILGIDNKARKIIGAEFKKDRFKDTQHTILQMVQPAITFRNIYKLQTTQGQVIFLEIPAAPLGMPIACDGHYYARAGESLKSLGLDKLDEMRNQSSASDWTAHIVNDATITNLDSIALQRSREAFMKKYANRFDVDEMLSWSDMTFLDRAKLTINGNITRTTLLLLGKPEAAHLLLPYPSQLTWKLEGPERAYQHFGLPFILNTTHLYQLIRNVQIRILPQDDLFPIEVAKYDQKIFLEALHNCIAHQDYSRNGRVIVTERLDRLIFENEGSFFEGSPIDYISGEKTPRRYRNPFLTQAMSELNMIDTMGYGIHQMYIGQARRYFPMPDYDLSDPKAVKMTLYGSIVDPTYSKLLIQKTDLKIDEIFALDRIQKKLPIDDSKIKFLRQRKLIEGRKPNFHVSASIASVTASKADYIRTRAQDDTFYIKLINDYLLRFSSATRIEIDKLLWEKLSDGLSDNQKKNKINNLIFKMRSTNKIKNSGSDRKPKWILLK